MGLNRCQNCANYEVGYTMTMVGKTVFKRTTQSCTYLYGSAMAALIQSSPGDRKFFLPCCIIKHTLCALEPADGSPTFADLGASFS